MENSIITTPYMAAKIIDSLPDAVIVPLHNGVRVGHASPVSMAVIESVVALNSISEKLLQDAKNFSAAQGMFCGASRDVSLIVDSILSAKCQSHT